MDFAHRRVNVISHLGVDHLLIVLRPEEEADAAFRDIGSAADSNSQFKSGFRILLCILPFKKRCHGSVVLSVDFRFRERNVLFSPVRALILL
jgi:hypothetical protein